MIRQLSDNTFNKNYFFKIRYFRFLIALCLPLFFSIIFIEKSQAKVFDFSREHFANYFAYSTGPSLVKKTPFLNEASTTYTYNDEFANNVSVELGFVYSYPKIAFRFGFELIKPIKLSNVLVKDASDATMYSMDSDISGQIPKVGVEMTLYYSPQSRWLLNLSGGFASVTITNTYTLTAAGQAAHPGVANHSVIMTGTGMSYTGSFAYEGWLNDNTTWILELGYEYLPLAALKYSNSVTTFSGAVIAGDPVNDISGTARAVNFTYTFGTLGIRIYL